MIIILWNDPRLDRIVKMRFEQSPSAKLIEVAGCLGKMKDGNDCRVELPFRQLPKTDYYGAMLDYARRDNVHLKGLGIFNGTSIILLWRKAS